MEIRNEVLLVVVPTKLSSIHKLFLPAVFDPFTTNYFSIALRADYHLLDLPVGDLENAFCGRVHFQRAYVQLRMEIII